MDIGEYGWCEVVEQSNASGKRIGSCQCGTGLIGCETQHDGASVMSTDHVRRKMRERHPDWVVIICLPCQLGADRVLEEGLHTAPVLLRNRPRASERRL
jgi:hypothetical protein